MKTLMFEIRTAMPTVILVSLLAVPSVARAQGSSGSAPPSYGLVGGPGSSTYSSTNDADDFARRTGFLAGIYIGSGSERLVEVLLELMAGHRSSINRIGSGLEHTYGFWIGSVPMTVRVNLGQGRFAPFAGGGLSFDLRVSRAEIKSSSGQTFPLSANRGDLGGHVGVGVRAANLEVEVRYTHGLRGLLTGGGSSDFAPELKSRTILTLLRWNFGDGQ